MLAKRLHYQVSFFTSLILRVWILYFYYLPFCIITIITGSCILNSLYEIYAVRCSH